MPLSTCTRAPSAQTWTLRRCCGCGSRRATWACTVARRRVTRPWWRGCSTPTRDSGGSRTLQGLAQALLLSRACCRLTPASPSSRSPARRPTWQASTPFAPPLLRCWCRIWGRRGNPQPAGPVPAAAAAACAGTQKLLAADNFGTDSEYSVFLLLAYLLDARKGLPEVTRAELCGLVRLHRLSSTYLYHVLPAYQPFVISRADLGFLLHCASASEQGKAELLAWRGFPWYCSPPRRQVVPEGGCNVEWSFSREQLEQGLRKMLEGGHVVCDFVHTVRMRGLSWRVEPLLIPMAPTCSGAPAVGFQSGVYLKCGSPTVFGPSWVLGPAQGAVAVSARLAVHRWDGAQREEVWLRLPQRCEIRKLRGGRMLAAGSLQRRLPLLAASEGTRLAPWRPRWRRWWRGYCL